MSASREWAPPQQFDEYRLMQPLGHGGMGHVFLAYDTLLDRMVAVKFISAIEPNSEARERFLIEARAAARLQHPNVAAVYRVGELDNRPYIISEFIRGTTLDRLEIPIPWRRALELGVFLARGLAAAHRHGVLHRDIKPSNAILAEDGEVKLVDFGLAKLTDDSSVSSERPSTQHQIPKARVSSTDMTIGPEDLVSLTSGTSRHGVVVIEDAENVDHTLQSAREQPPPPPAEEAPASQTLISVGEAEGPRPARAKEGEIAIAVEGLTRDGDVMGTPYYMAPEVWRGEAGTRRSDVYALGVVLYELCAGFPPHREIRVKDLRRVRSEQDAQPLLDIAPQVDARFADIVDRCLERDPSLRFASADELLEALEQLVPAANTAKIPEGNPYRGLHSFEAEHRALFFGRSGEIRALIDRLRSEPFVLVAGDSGTGKSSLCRAGVLPLVEEDALQEGRNWSVVRLVPGRRPLAGLAAKLAPLLHNREEEGLITELTNEPDQVCRDLRKRLVGKLGLVIFVDQLEELLTLSSWEDATAAASFFGRIAAGVPGVRLLATVRGDFLTRLARLPGFANDITRALYLLRPMSPDHIREAIVGPAKATGVRFESDELVEALVASTGRTEGALPLLQFALAELWEARDKIRQSIQASALDAMGGVEGALARHADGVLAGLLPSERSATRRILMRLVTAEGSRTRRTEDELVLGDAAASAALDALVRGRLLAAREVEGQTAYEVAHDALLTGWATLREWLDAQAESRAVRQRLESAAVEWERLGRTREALWSARQMGEAAALRDDELQPREAEFLRASKRAVRMGRYLRNGLISAVPLLIGLTLGAVELRSRRALNQRVQTHLVTGMQALATARTKNSDSEELTKDAFAKFDSLDLAAGESIWSRAVVTAEEASKSYAEASQSFEAALVLDGTRSDIRTLGADSLYERALLAARAHNAAQRDELLGRMALYDEAGEHKKRLTMPATVTLTTPGVAAQVTAELYVEENGRIRCSDAKILGQTPLHGSELAPGSYTLVIAAAGRVEIRYPLLLEPAEAMSAVLEMPPADQIPRGFVYIPAGRFFFGTTLDDRIRRAFLGAVPAHPVRTDAYVIARTETTYGEWIEFLESLPPKVRAAHAPKTGSRGAPESLELAQLPDGDWQLTFQPSAHAHTARRGQMVDYKARSQNGNQDWLRFPVSGVSAEDSDAYASWLRSSGRVPGARICTEHEWERAARGADMREYPHGDRLDPDDANFTMTYGKDPLALGPDQVGLHSASRSPFGVDDMAGNVWEWTVSSLNTGQFVARGGGYFFSELSNRSTNREVMDATGRPAYLGLRICASWPAR